MGRHSRHTWWERADRVGRAIETVLIVLFLGGLIVFASAQIILRNFFSVGLTWGDGLTRLVVLWLALVGALAASRDGRHITMGAVIRWLPAGLQRATGVLADLFATVVSSFLAWSAWGFVRDSREFGDLLLGDVPAWWLQAIMPVAFALIAYQFALRCLRRLRGVYPPSEER